MACKNCTETSYPKSAYYSAYQGCKQLNSCSTSCDKPIDSACVVYTGPAFVNIPLDSNVCVETVISTIDGMLAAVTGNYSTYNTACLGTQNTQQEFVETISAYVCEIRTDLDTFINTTFPAEKLELQEQIDDIVNPNLPSSCISLGISPTDTNKQVLNKLATSVCDIYSQIDLSTANWNSCFTIVGTPPTTPLQAVNALIGQICSIKGTGGTGALPTFNNTGTCIPGGSATDSLVFTVTSIRDITCTKPSLNINTLTFGCVSKPSNVATDLQGTLQSILTNLTNVNQQLPTFNPSDFTMTPVDPLNLCLGYQVSLASAVAPTDRLVAVDNADMSPGTLVDKLVAVSPITLTPSGGTLQIGINTASITPDGRVKTRAADPTLGYLEAKIKATGDANGLNLTTVTDITDNKVNVVGSLNINLIATRILEEIADDVDLKAILCSLIASCPIACTPPTNVTVTSTP